MSSRLEYIFAAMMLDEKIRDWITEYRFDEKRQWRFDYAWPGIRLAVEIEGGIGILIRGRHCRPKGFADDCEKYNSAALQGWTVLRFTREMVMSGIAVKTTKQALAQRALRAMVEG